MRISFALYCMVLMMQLIRQAGVPNAAFWLKDTLA